jgi:hypothetical protein
MKEYIAGGKAEGMCCEDIAKKFNLPVETIKKQEAMGIKIEHEHTPDDEIAAEIARDHLAEFPSYYTYLAEMEAKAKKDGDDKPRKKEKQSEEEADAAKKARLKQLFG